MHGTLKALVQNQWEAAKSSFKMEFYTEPRSQCRTCDYGWQLIQNQWQAVKSPFKLVHWTAICDCWFKTSERLFLTLYLLQSLTTLSLSLLLLFAEIVGVVYHLLFIVIIVAITIIVYRSYYYYNYYNYNNYYYHSWYCVV